MSGVYIAHNCNAMRGIAFTLTLIVMNDNDDNDELTHSFTVLPPYRSGYQNWSN